MPLPTCVVVRDSFTHQTHLGLVTRPNKSNSIPTASRVEHWFRRACVLSTGMFLNTVCSSPSSHSRPAALLECLLYLKQRKQLPLKGACWQNPALQERELLADHLVPHSKHNGSHNKSLGRLRVGMTQSTHSLGVQCHHSLRSLSDLTAVISRRLRWASCIALSVNTRDAQRA